jgi:hypothetical protein
MPEINLVIDGVKGSAVERFAALAGKPVDQLILSWIEDKVNHAVVVAMRAGGATWEAVATELSVSITHARRIYAAGSEFQPVGKDDLKAAEKYLKLVEEIRDLANEGDLFPTPSQEHLNAIEAYNELITDLNEVGDPFPVPSEVDIDMIERYNQALPDASEIEFPVPSEEDIEAVERYSKATRE